ncbi:hypothetical protein ACHABQ_03045 [Nesterenkonia aurantiaca]|uniref:hypothetical protein n=1 Tax=Nesterenkonia aurantiaca TaxID=1436010 RepID=UPI003EE6FD7A
MNDIQKVSPDDSLLYAVKKVIADAIYAEMKDEKTDFTDRLLGEYINEGTPKKVARLPNGDVVANHTVSQPKRQQRIHRQTDFDGWLKENHPEVFVQRTVTEVDGAAVAKIFSDATEVGDELFTSEGEPIPGIEVTTPEARSFSTTFPKGAKEKLLEAWHDGELQHLLGGRETVLRQIGGIA